MGKRFILIVRYLSLLPLIHLLGFSIPFIKWLCIFLIGFNLIGLFFSNELLKIYPTFYRKRIKLKYSEKTLGYLEKWDCSFCLFISLACLLDIGFSNQIFVGWFSIVFGFFFSLFNVYLVLGYDDTRNLKTGFSATPFDLIAFGIGILICGYGIYTLFDKKFNTDNYPLITFYIMLGLIYLLCEALFRKESRNNIKN